MTTIAFINAWGLLLRGGPMMWPIFLLSILAVAIGLEKWMSLARAEKNVRQLETVFLTAIRENRMKDALAVCEKVPGGMGAVYKAGLMKFGASMDVVRAAMEKTAGFQVHALKQRMNLLSWIVNAAPLLGLLGTASAMCVVFRAVQMRSDALNPLSLGDMSSGIWQALLTTCAGLLVGIISFAIYSFCAGRLNDLIVIFDQSITESSGLLQAMSELDRSGGVDPI